jgi:hypothetical protein
VGWEAECMTCTPGSYISIANKGSGDLEIDMNSEEHCRNIRGETSSEKLTKYFVKSIPNLMKVYVLQKVHLLSIL